MSRRVAIIGGGILGVAVAREVLQRQPDADVTVMYVPPAVITSYRITASELTRLVAALPPSADAPSDFSYVSFPFILTVRNGVAIAADQRYVS